MIKHNKKFGIISIRPKYIFQLIEKKFGNLNNTFIVNIPSSEIGGLTLLEHSLLVSFIKLFHPEQIFEYGTYMGASSFVMAANSAKSASIYTLDIPKDQSDFSEPYNSNSDDIKNDNYLRSVFVEKGAIYIKQADQNIRSKITQIYCDSHKLNLDEYNLRKRFDFIFIDGGHDYKTIKNDTDKSLEMVKEDAIIIWHDFKSNLHTNVTDFINDFSKNHLIIHIESTMLAFTLMGKHKTPFFN